MLPYMYMSKIKGHMSKTLSLSFSTNTSHFNVIVYLVEDQFGIKIINNLGIPDKKGARIIEVTLYLHGPMINPTAWKEDMLAIAGVLSFIVVAPETYDRTTATLPIQPNKNITLTRFLRSPWYTLYSTTILDKDHRLAHSLYYNYLRQRLSSGTLSIVQLS